MGSNKKASAEATGELDQLRELTQQDEKIVNGSTKTPHSRRGLLKMAGAALAGAAGTMALRAVPAAAATGQAVLQGCLNFATTDGATTLDMGNTAGNTPTSVNGAALIVQGGTGVKGAGYFTTDHSQEIGLFGMSKGNSTDGNTSTATGTGVLGAAQAGVGVQGVSITGTAGQFVSSTGYDALLGQAISGTIADPDFHGSGRLAMVGRTDVGNSGPNIPVLFLTHSSLFAGGHFQHELVRGNDGSIWASRADLTGTTSANQFRWKRINAVRVDSADGLGAPYAPFRVFDTRLLTPHPKKAVNSVTVVPIAGQGAGNSHIPADAIAIMGNLTATGYTAPGFLALSPNGVAVTTSSVNFITGQAAIANSFIVGLAGGAVQVKVAGSATHFVIDVTGYIQ